MPEKGSHFGYMLGVSVPLSVDYGAELPRRRVSRTEGGELSRRLHVEPVCETAESGVRRVTMGFFEVRQRSATLKQLEAVLRAHQHRLCVVQELIALDQQRPKEMETVFDMKLRALRRQTSRLPVIGPNSRVKTRDGMVVMPVLLWCLHGGEQWFNLQKEVGDPVETIVPVVPIGS